jgi:hypothetical protein
VKSDDIGDKNTEKEKEERKEEDLYEDTQKSRSLEES